MPLRLRAQVAAVRLRRAAVIEKILPSGVECAEAFSDPPGIVLFPEEEALPEPPLRVEVRKESITKAHASTTQLLVFLLPTPNPPLRVEGGCREHNIQECKN